MTAFDSHRVRFFDLEWHRKARKTTLAVNLLIRECCAHDSCVYGYVSPTYKKCRRDTWDDPNMLDAYLPDQAEFGWTKNEQKLSVTFDTKSVLRFMGADEPNSLRGPTYAGIVLDEWSYMKPETWLAVLRPILAVSTDFWVMFLWTPCGENHATAEQAVRRQDKKWFLSQLRASQSKLLSEEQLADAAKDMPYWIYQQEFELAHVTDEQRAFITSAMMDALRDSPQVYQMERRRILSLDPAFMGDECVAMAIEDGRILEIRPIHQRDTKLIVLEGLAMLNQYNISDVVVDVIGIGKGVADGFQDIAGRFGLTVWPFDSCGASSNDRLLNRKAEAWWYVMQKIRNLELPYITDLETRRQLCAVRYDQKEGSGKIKCEAKDKTKKLLGCSPDRADAYVMGIYTLPKIEPIWRQAGIQRTSSDLTRDRIAELNRQYLMPIEI